jgi:oligopeptidase B
VFEAHGVKRRDDYAWLKDANDQCAIAYMRGEREHYDSATAHLLPFRRRLLRELTSRTPAADSSLSWRRGERIYYTRTDEGQEYPSLYQVDPGLVDREVDAEGPDRLLLDPNALAQGSYLELGLLEPSPDGRWLAYSVDHTGEEVYQLRFRDLTTGQDLIAPDGQAEVVPRTYYTGAWTADSTGFLYTVPDPAYRPDRVRLHRLGTDGDADVTLLAEPDRRFELTVQASRDGGWVTVTSLSRDTAEVHLVDARASRLVPRCVAPRRPGVEYAVEVLPGDWDGAGPDRLLIVTDDGEPEFRLMQAPLPPDDGRPGDPALWEPVPRAVAGPFERLVAAHVLARHVVLELRRDGEPFLRVLDRLPGPDGRRPIREIHPGLPAGQLTVWKAEDPAATSVVLVEQNLVTPPAWVQVDLATGARTVLKRTPAPGVDLGRYLTERILAPSADGTEVPVTVARLRDPSDVGGIQGCLLYGYGAYEACSWPEFSAATLSLLDRGLVYAVAHVRGGGELGRGWWLDGRLRSKRHSVEDFVAARDALVAADLAGDPAGSGGVVSRGLSAGGLLQGMAYSQAPDRWRAVVAEVPFVDVVTTMSDPEVPLTVNEWDEWGDPLGSADDFRYLLGYSPYDNVPPPGRPPLLVTGALHDPRVLVHEPAKWVAKLRATDDPEHPSTVLFRVELGDGAHSGPTGRWAALAYEAEVCAWVLDRFGLATLDDDPATLDDDPATLDDDSATLDDDPATLDDKAQEVEE